MTANPESALTTRMRLLLTSSPAAVGGTDAHVIRRIVDRRNTPTG
jgi:hypothetical protein